MWGDHTTQDINFTKGILISNIDDLLPGRDSLTIRYDKIDQLQLAQNKFGERCDSAYRPGQTANLDQTAKQVSAAHEEFWVERLDTTSGVQAHDFKADTLDSKALSDPNK